jgi:hypothetical protein
MSICTVCLYVLLADVTFALDTTHVHTFQSICPNNIGGADRDRYSIELAWLILADFPIDNGSAEILLVSNIIGLGPLN